MKNNTRLTIFTPTYNREDLIVRLYDSLKKQTNKNFIWLVIDDGSTDNTKDLFDKYLSENDINIKYMRKENGGKFSAMDMAHSICETDYIAGVDSDDYLVETAVDDVYRDIEKLSGDEVGIVQRKFDTQLIPFSESWVGEDKLIYFYELADKYNYTKDTFLIFKTDIVKNYHFPNIEGENFRTESILYNQFFYDHKILATSKTCYVAEYQEDGYSQGAARLLFKNPKSSLYAFKSDAYYYTKYNRKFVDTILAWSRYYAWRRFANLKDFINDEYNIRSYKKFFGWILSIPMYFRYKKKLKNQSPELKEKFCAKNK